MQLAINVMLFLNEVICMDLRCFGSIALLGGLPLICKYANGEASFQGTQANDLRLQAAYLVQTLAQGSLNTSQLLFACQVSILQIQ